MKRKRRLRNGIISFVLALAIVIGTFSGIIPGTVTSVKAANTTTVTLDSSNLGNINLNTDTAGQTISSSKIGGITVSITSSGKPIEFYGNPSIKYHMDVNGTGFFTFASSIGNIKKIVITAQNISWYDANAGWSKDGSTFVWSGTPSETVTLTGEGGSYIWDISSIVFTIELPTVTSNVTLNTNGGTINSGNVTTYDEGTGAALPTDVIKDGYIFDGWYASSDFSGDKVTAISTTETGNKEYWAKWTMAGDMQIFIKGMSGGTPKSIDVYESDTIAITKEKIVDVFNTSQGVKKLIFAGRLLEDDKTLADYNIQKEATLHVIFDNEYTVSFNTNGGSAVSSQTLVSGSKVTKPGDPEKDGYTFAGWYSDEGLTSQYNFDNEVSSDFTLYAKWTPITYTVTLHANGGTIADGKDVTGYTYGTDTTLPTVSDMSKNG